MEGALTEQEMVGDRRGKIAAGLGFLAVVALLLIPVFFFQNPPPGQPGILVNLGFVDVGQGEENAGPAAPAAPPVEEPVEEPTPPPPAATPPPPAATPEPPKPVQREVIQQEDPAEVALRRQRAQEEARRQEQERREEATRNAREQERQREIREENARRERAAEAERQRQAEAEAARRAREAEANNTRSEIGGLFGNGSGNGNTGKPGNQGVEDGDPNADRLTGISTSDGRVSGGLGGRGVLASPAVRENSQVSGIVMVSVCVNSDGNVVSASFTQNGSRNATSELIRAAVANAKKWKFSPGTVDRQCGKISYNFKVQ